LTTFCAHSWPKRQSDNRLNVRSGGELAEIKTCE
jgi:hypothetical protein